MNKPELWSFTDAGKALNVRRETVSDLVIRKGLTT